MSLISFRAAAVILFLSITLFRILVRYRPLVLIACSLLFLADSPTLLIMHSVHTALTLALAYLMCRYGKAKKAFLAVGVLVNCLSLIRLHGIGGFSYAVLIHIGFLLDIYSGKKIERIGGSAAALTYFPCLQEGPIIDASAVSEQLSEIASPSWERGSHAVLRIAVGMIKKLVVADRLFPFVDSVYASPQSCGAGTLWLAMLVYAVQIYMDFSGCMDVVLGASALIGIDLPENFCRPYLADSFSEYWRRWHITMGAWFKRRLFYPMVTSVPMLKLAGRLNRVFRNGSGTGLAMATPLLVTWTLVGIWHGPALHYVLWGVVNGLLILAERVLFLDKRSGPKAVRIAGTFLMVSLTRVLFRTESVNSAFRFYLGLFRFTAGSLSYEGAAAGLLAAILAALIFFLYEIYSERNGAPEISVSGTLVLITLSIAAVLIFGCYGPGYSPTEFYYNRF